MKAGIALDTDDRDLQVAYLLHKNPGMSWEGLGYPPGDAILVDLLMLLS